MSDSGEGRSTSPPNLQLPSRGRRSRSLSRSRGRSRSRSRDSGRAGNPGNNLYVTGLSTRVNSNDLEKYFGNEGKVLECHLVTDPRTKESRGFGFVTMETVEDADRCIKYLNRSVLEGRLITVAKIQKCGLITFGSSSGDLMQCATYSSLVERLLCEREESERKSEAKKAL
ncbi:hypothetical protein HHK36_027677 [Tetracentron sinense]|uniref:RRM domain-containing protein n=1 Tax=Tetracentron sinense TaxID=13715 RepID=A0A834YH35_TETSI|nr:hypothetical protein HHK36_027677 [Tetracentron sinense]